jgi:sodium-dependent dicarboxylate transporter 2/3/5
VFVLCVLFWVFQVVPLQITSIMAIVLLPLTGVMTSPKPSRCSQQRRVFHPRRVHHLGGARRVRPVHPHHCLVLQKAATTPRGLRGGILLFGAFASFWMSEHAVAAMMYPIILSIVTGAV